MERYRVVNINSYQLLSLLDEIENDRSDYVKVKPCILDAWKDNNLYGIISTNPDDRMLCNKYNPGLLPCFCIKDGNVVIGIWTHRRIRHRGFAKLLLTTLKLKFVYNPYRHCPDFWTHHNILLSTTIPKYHIPMY